MRPWRWTARSLLRWASIRGRAGRRREASRWSHPRPQTIPGPTSSIRIFRDVDIAIARTRGEYGGEEGVREIEALYVDMIRSAKRFLYAENR